MRSFRGRTSLVLAVASMLLAGACYSVPGTGRKQFRVVPLGTEMSLGAQAFDETLAEEKTIKSGPQAQMVARVGERIAAAAKRLYPQPSLDFDWQIVLIDEPKTINAWCLPGGKMAVYTGLLPVTQDEDSLAVVVGHEVAHAVARHGGERMSQEIAFGVGLTAASVSMGDMEPGQKDQIMQALTGAGELGVLLPFSRKHETEADELGLFLAADAGYDPRSAIGLWQRMAAASKGNAPPEFLSTHPSDKTRIKKLEALMPHAMEYYERAKSAGR
jgi:metalloendopeptidase OMA1, mitochondrial